MSPSQSRWKETREAVSAEEGVANETYLKLIRAKESAAKTE